MNRLLIKVLSWRFISVLSMLMTMWILTGDLVKSTSVTLIVQVVQTIVHTVFEATWEKKIEKRASRKIST
jgi:uncharacterized membrane protein